MEKEEGKEVKKEKNNLLNALIVIGVIFFFVMIPFLGSEEGKKLFSLEEKNTIEEQYSGLSTTESYEDNTIKDNSSTSNSYKKTRRITADFDDEMGIRLFLCRYVFEDEEGNKIRFDEMANQLIMNGRVLSSVLNIQGFTSNKAILVFGGPYGQSSFTLVVADGEAAIQDNNDFTIFYAKQ